MNSGSDAIHEYCEQFTSDQDELLKEIERATHLETTQPRMLSGHLQGRYLSFLSQLQQPRRILEIGTFTGYATLCLAEGLSKAGEIHTLEVNPELEQMLHRFFEASEYTNQIHLHITDAGQFLSEYTGEPWDLIFLDAAKKNYPEYFDLLQDQTKSGSVIIADNVLWSGKVLDSAHTDASTTALRDYAKKVHAHRDWQNVMVPLRDGLLMARKK
jgi:predicted O-methyltransferase YrrM